jgi:hypothetical protein
MRLPRNQGSNRHVTRPVKNRFRPDLVQLEIRDLLAAVSVAAGQVVDPVSTQVMGANVAWWATNLNTAQTQQMVQDAGMTMFRIPGGSSTDLWWHFNSPVNFFKGEATMTDMASFIASVNGVGMATLNYGSGSPQEGAAFLAYLNAPVGNTTPIGDGQEWGGNLNQWVAVDWKTADYWAGLRASAPLAVDDGLNFLRLDHPAPFGFHDFEVGNEEYGWWETDHHGSGGDTGQIHDPATYVAFAKQFAGLAAQIDPTIAIGLDADIFAGDTWTPGVLQQCAVQGLLPAFLSDHAYAVADGSDSGLLLHTVTDPTSPFDWASRAAAYRGLLQQYLGSAGAGVALLATEFNSGTGGKQFLSLVNGLFVADSLGSLLDSGYNGADFWDLVQGYYTSGPDSPSLYGWRQGGDLGMFGSAGDGPPPAAGPYVPYPTYFAEHLVSKMVYAGGNVVQASSDDPNLSAYAVLETNGHLDLLVINKSPTDNLTGQFQVTGFQPASQAQVWQYGQAQDTAQSQTTDGYSALANFGATLTLNGSNFSYSFPAYSMTVLDLGAASLSGDLTPTIQAPPAATPNPGAGTTTTLTALGADADYPVSQLTYTWAVSSMPPGTAAPTFSVNGTNAASTTTATFHHAGSYTFQLTIADPGHRTVSSSVTVVVDQTMTGITVAPPTAWVADGKTLPFSATATDQFGDPVLDQPAFSWSVDPGGAGGTIDAAGVYTAPASGTGVATVRAASGTVSGTDAARVFAISGSVSFLGEDATTQGNWKGSYGGDGFNLAQDSSSNNPSFPAYATVAITGSSNYLWSGSTTDTRALQKSTAGSSDRLAACWHTGDTLSIDVHLSDGAAHQIALYALDWDNFQGGRSERIDVIDDATGAVLDTRNLSSFQNGVYLVWSVTGNVTLRLTNLSLTANAVLSGLFFGGAPPAAFVTQDTSTRGNWRSAYGGTGFDIAQDASASNPTIPAYATVAITGNGDYTWSGSTTDTRALEKSAAGSSDQLAACWYTGSTLSIDVHLSDGAAHQIALYALDWDNYQGGRSERIDVIDDATGTVLDTRNLSLFQNGVYLVWNVTGNVTFRLTNLNPSSNAVLSGLFFGGSPSLASAAFVTQDTTTQGNWDSAYGSAGFDIAQDPSSDNPTFPADASVAITGNSAFTWSDSTLDPRALQKAAGGSTSRVAACWYSSGTLSFDVNFTDGAVHQIVLYALDWDSYQGGRSEQFDVIDTAGNRVLDSRSISGFQNGVYLVWNVSGHVTIQVTNLNPSSNAVVSGLFFNPAG